MTASVPHERDLVAGSDDEPLPGDRTPARSTEHRLLLALACLGLPVLLALALLLEPDARGHGTHEQLGLRPCYPMLTFEVPCPGCGVTTSVVHLARGELWSSIVVQPLGTALGLGWILFAAWAVRGHLRGRDLWLELNRRDVPRACRRAFLFVALAWAYKLGSVRGWW